MSLLLLFESIILIVHPKSTEVAFNVKEFLEVA